MEREQLVTKLASRDKKAGWPALLLATGAGSLIGNALNKGFGEYDLTSEEGREKAKRDELIARLTGGGGGLAAALAMGAHKNRGLIRSLARGIW